MCVPAQLITTRGVNVSQAPSAPRDPPPPSLVLQECTVMTLSWPSLKVPNSKGLSLPSCVSNQFNVLLKWYIVQELYFYSFSIQLCVHHGFFKKKYRISFRELSSWLLLSHWSDWSKPCHLPLYCRSLLWGGVRHAHSVSNRNLLQCYRKQQCHRL